MKITAARIRNFRCHADLAVPFDDITFILGPNGSGKSSIRAAIEYALTGRCALWTDGRGAGADALVRDGAKQACVELDIAEIGTLKRSIPNSLEVSGLVGTTTAQQAALRTKLGLSEQVISAVLNTPAFLALDPKAQQAMLFDLLGLQFTQEEVAAQVAAYCERLGADRDRAASWVRGTILEGRYGPEVFGVLQEKAVVERRAAKKLKADQEAAAKAQGAPVELPAGVTLGDEEAVRSQLESVRSEREGLARELAQVDYALKVREAAAEQRAELEREIAALEAQGAQGASPDLQEFETARAFASRYGQEATVRAEELSRERATLAGLHVRLSTLQKALEAVRGAGDDCPLAPKMVKCPMGREDRAKLEGRLEADIAKLEQEIARQDRRVKELTRQVDELRKAEREALRAAANLEQAAKGSQASAERLATLRARLESLQGPDDGSALSARHNELTQAIAGIDERLRKGQGLLEAILQAKGAEAAKRTREEALAKATRALEITEALCQACGPNGVRAEILGQRLGQVQERANRLLGVLTAGEYGLELRAEESLEILVTRRGAAPRPCALLSDSERFRVGMVLQDALSHLAGARLLVIDSADVLDPGNRALLASMLLEVRGDYDTIIVLATLGTTEPTDPGIPGLTVMTLGGPGGGIAKVA